MFVGDCEEGRGGWEMGGSARALLIFFTIAREWRDARDPTTVMLKVLYYRKNAGWHTHEYRTRKGRLVRVYFIKYTALQGGGLTVSRRRWHAASPCVHARTVHIQT